MVTYLPQEILALIVEHVCALAEKESQVKLTDYTLVNNIGKPPLNGRYGRRSLYSVLLVLKSSLLEVASSTKSVDFTSLISKG